MNDEEREKLIKAYKDRRRQQFEWAFFAGFMVLIIGMPLVFAYLQSVAPAWANQYLLVDREGRGFTTPLGLTCFFGWCISIFGLLVTISVMGESSK